MSNLSPSTINTGCYAKCIEVSKRIRWDIDHDVIRGRSFDFGKKFLPDGLSKVAQLPFLSDGKKRLYSQVQRRTYACNLPSRRKRRPGECCVRLTDGASPRT